LGREDITKEGMYGKRRGSKGKDILTKGEKEILFIK